MFEKMPAPSSNRRADAAKQRRVREHAARVQDQQAVLESLRAGQPIKGAVSANPIVAGLQNFTKSLGGYFQPDLYPAQLGGKNVLVGGPGSQLMPVNVGGQTLYPMKSGDRVIYRSTSETTPLNTFLKQGVTEEKPEVTEEKPEVTSPPTSNTPIVTGLTPNGEIDRTQSDEYKSIRAQYDALRKRGESAMTPEGMREKALDYGLTEWAKLHPTLAARQQAGSFNPLMQSTFGYQTGEAPDQVQRSMVIGGQRYDVDPEAIQYQIDMNAGDPLMQQERQQQFTAEQANQGLEKTESVLKRTDAFLNPYYKRMY